MGKHVSPQQADTAAPQKSRAKRWAARGGILFALIVLLLLLLRQCVFMPSAAPAIVVGDLFPGEGNALEGALENMTQEDLLAQMQRVADENYFSFKINAAPYFQNGRSAGNLEIENPSYNVYPTVVQIELAATGQIIYDSGGLMPNQHIQSDTLSVVLPAGEHEAVATLFAYDPNTLECKGQSQVQMKITVAE